MLSISPVPGDGSYYTQLGRDDYYLDGGEPAGLWCGEGARRLGLVGRVEPAVFTRVLDGFGPDGSTPWVQNAGDSKRQRGWDLTFSTPKSVSLLWAALSEDPSVAEILRDAQRRAVARALAYLEETASWGRTGKGGLGRAKLTLVAAAFEHASNRLQEVHLHTHVVLANVGVGEDGATRTILSQKFYQAKMTAGAVYRAELGHQLRTRLGVALEPERTWFQISGIPKSLLDASSSRRKEILAKLGEIGSMSAKAAEIAALDTRSPKEALPRQVLLEKWRQEAAKHGLSPEAARLLRNPQLQLEDRDVSQEIVTSRIEGILNQRSYFAERDLVRAVAEQTQSLGVSVDRILIAVRRGLEQLISLGIHRQERQYTTPLMLALERDILERAVNGSRLKHHQVRPARAEAAIRTFGLSAEQASALRDITTRPGAVAVVEGLAGTGKSTLLNAARVAWEAQGLEVIGCSLSGKAAEGLEKSSGIRSHTIARLLLQWGRDNPAVPKPKRNTVVVIDEAGMVGTRAFTDLSLHVHRTGAKLVLVGDSRQLPAIEAGNPFRSLGKVLGHSQLTDIKRQLDEWNREVVRSFAQGDVQSGLDGLKAKGLVHVEKDRQALMDSLFAEWMKHPDRDKTIILAGTREEVDAINREAQRRLWGRNEIGTIPGFVGGNFFYPGDRLLFTRNDRKLGVKNGTLGTVKQAWGTGISVTLDSGKVVFLPAIYGDARLGYAVTTHKSQGMTVDTSFVVFSEAMQGLETSYVQVSRARKATHLFLTEAEAGSPDLKDAVRAMAREEDKRSAIDLLPRPIRPTSVEQEELRRRESREISR